MTDQLVRPAPLPEFINVRFPPEMAEFFKRATAALDRVQDGLFQAVELAWWDGLRTGAMGAALCCLLLFLLLGRK